MLDLAVSSGAAPSSLNVYISMFSVEDDCESDESDDCER